MYTYRRAERGEPGYNTDGWVIIKTNVDANFDDIIGMADTETLAQLWVAAGDLLTAAEMAVVAIDLDAVYGDDVEGREAAEIDAVRALNAAIRKAGH